MKVGLVYALEVCHETIVQRNIHGVDEWVRVTRSKVIVVVCDHYDVIVDGGELDREGLPCWYQSNENEYHRNI